MERSQTKDKKSGGGNSSQHRASGDRGNAWCFIASEKANLSGPRYLSHKEEFIWLKRSLPPTFFTKEPSLVDKYHSRKPINQVISITRHTTKTYSKQIAVTIKRISESSRVLVGTELLSPDNDNKVTVLLGRKLDISIGRYCITLRNCKEEGNIPVDVLENYNLIGDLAETSSSSVYKIQDKDNREFAALKVERSIGSRDRRMMNEIEILRKISHENIISIVSADTDPRKHHLITPFATGGDLMLFPSINMVRTTENQANKVFRQVISAISYLHQNQIAHRDIKPENILLMDNTLDRVRLTGFSSSCIIPESGYMNDICGTFSYMSPIVMDNYLHNLKRIYSKKTDIWSLGVCMYVFLLGELPFIKRADDDEDYFQKVTDKIFTLSFKRLSEPLKTILLDCLEIVESNRPQAHELLDYYAWFSDTFKFDTETFCCFNCEKIFETQLSLFNHQYDCGSYPWQ